MLIGLTHPKKGNILLKDCVKEFADIAPKPLVWDILENVNQSWRKGKVSPSMIMSCPMKSWLQQEVGYYSLLEDLYWAGFRGTLKHEALAKYAESNNDLLIEKRMATKIGGVEITGQVDAYDPPEQTLTDWKTCKYIKVGYLPYSEHITQVKTYALILEDNNYPVKEIQIVYMDAGGWAVVHISKGGAYVVHKDKEEWKKTEIKDLFLQLAAEFRAEIKDRVILLDKIMRGKIKAPCEPGFLCNGNNRTKKIYCPLKDKCPYWVKLRDGKKK